LHHGLLGLLCVSGTCILGADALSLDVARISEKHSRFPEIADFGRGWR
jgi:hypothetical protein